MDFLVCNGVLYVRMKGLFGRRGDVITLRGVLHRKDYHQKIMKSMILQIRTKMDEEKFMLLKLSVALVSMFTAILFTVVKN